MEKLSFVASLSDSVELSRCHPETVQYRENYYKLKFKLAKKLFAEFNQYIFDNKLNTDMPIIWTRKLKTTAGYAMYRQTKTQNGTSLRACKIHLSVKILSTAQNLRDVLIHELCHVAAWVIDGQNSGHGVVWKKWVYKSLKVFPELRKIPTCHSIPIHYKYTYECKRCGYRIHRDSKSIDTNVKSCKFCYGKFEIIENTKKNDNVIVSTEGAKTPADDFKSRVKNNLNSVDVANPAETVLPLRKQIDMKNKRTINSDIIDLCSD